MLLVGGLGGLRRWGVASLQRERWGAYSMRILISLAACKLVSMRRRAEKTGKCLLFLVLAALALPVLACAQDGDEGNTRARGNVRETVDSLSWPADRGFAIQLDNDLFSGAHRDEDYSWGVAVSFATPTTNRLFAPLDRVRHGLYSWLTPGSADDEVWLQQGRSVQLGLLAMTPETLRSPEALPDDRPFANLAFVTTAEMRVLQNAHRARYSSFTVGALGLRVAETLHRNIHRMVGDEMPLGWEHQISDGGEPTARYVQAEQWLLGGWDAVQPDMPEVKLTASGSVGFLTEGSLALSTRWGRVQSPWWSFNPELTDYMAPPVVPVSRFGSDGLSELFAFAGVRVKARAYNALLQGQFRHSDVRVSSDDLAPLLAEAWVGLATTWSGLRVTYTIRYATEEMKREPGARSLIWAGINFEKAF